MPLHIVLLPRYFHPRQANPSELRCVFRSGFGIADSLAGCGDLRIRDPAEGSTFWIDLQPLLLPFSSLLRSWHLLAASLMHFQRRRRAAEKFIPPAPPPPGGRR